MFSSNPGTSVISTIAALTVYLYLYHCIGLQSAFAPLCVCSVDNLLDSGLYTGEITELCGGPGTGKTQVSVRIQTCITVQCIVEFGSVIEI